MVAKKKSAKPLEFADLMKIHRLSSITVSPLGSYGAFVTAKHDAEKNKVRSTIWMIKLKSGWTRKLTPGPGNHSAPAFSPDGKYLAFVSDREKKAGSQLWVMPISGGEARCVTKGWGGVGAPVWAPDSKRIAFSRQVVVSDNYDQGKDKSLDPAKGPETGKIYGLVNPKSSALVEDSLLFRHWDHWREKKRSHLFIVDVETGKMNDLTPVDADVPPISLGSARDYDFSPDGKKIVFAMNPDQVVARSTNNSIFVLTLRGIRAAGEMKCISNSEANDCQPRFTVDGKSIAYLAQKVPVYEADKFRIKIYNLKSGDTRVLLDRFDRNPHVFDFAGDDPANAVIFAAEDFGRITLYRLNLNTGKTLQITHGTYNGSFVPIPGSAEVLATRETTTDPADLYLLTPGKGIKPILRHGPPPEDVPPDAGCKAIKLTDFKKAVSGIKMKPAEEFWYRAKDKHPVHGLLVRPPGFRKGRKYPLILLIHGGPQGAFSDHFHYRWNAQMFAAKGAVVAFVNPRGSTGYGKKFKEEISRDWGGKCYDDIMAGVDYLLANYRFIDGKRMAAAGASFGGFMVNWIAGHTDRFKALVCHDGVFFAETMTYTTEELWFDEHEHGGLPHVNRKPFTKFSPHMFVGKFKTPTLVVHGGYDFRCPVSEGIGMFTALQVMNVPSRFLYFPDEGHWVQKPANSQVWYQQVVDWMMKYIGR